VSQVLLLLLLCLLCPAPLFSPMLLMLLMSDLAI
jgi:hypothetical protein